MASQEYGPAQREHGRAASVEHREPRLGHLETWWRDDSVLARVINFINIILQERCFPNGDADEFNSQILALSKKAIDTNSLDGVFLSFFVRFRSSF